VPTLEATASTKENVMTNTTVPTNQIELTVADSNALPWEMFVVPQTGAEIPSKNLFSDPDTGMQVFKMRYPAGFTNVWHTHSHAHGMYVLDGILNTHRGQYGAGSFVWFPEGGWMEHGATAGADVTFLFITNKPFAIMYQSDTNQPYPMFTEEYDL
jgi:quercetin dioxygenase-like cupin family protein